MPFNVTKHSLRNVYKYKRSLNTPRLQSGFTLIEIIIGIVLLSISMGIITSVILPAEEQSADNIHQIKAAELGQSMLDEILGRSFDQNSDHAGSIWRCDETGQAECTDEDLFGPEDGGGTAPDVRDDFDEEDRTLFNDVDDYHEFNELVTPTNANLHAGYSGFTIRVMVTYAGTYLGLSNTLAKHVIVSITTPQGEVIEFSGLKSNF